MSSVESGVPSGSAPEPAADPDQAAAADILETQEAGPAALRGGVLRTGAYVLGLLLSLISARVLIIHLGVSDFGRYVAVVSLITIVSGLSEGGLNGIVLREFATLDRDRRRQMIRSAIGIRLVLTVIGVALAVGFAAAVGYSSELVLGTALAGVGLVFQLLQSTLATTLQAQLRFGWMSAAELLRQIVNVGLLVALALAGAGLLPLLAVAIPASIVSLAMTIPLVLPYVSLKPSFHIGRWWQLLRETIPWAVIAAANVIYYRVAIVLMSLIAAAVETGYFATSFRITEVLFVIPGVVIGAAFPILARAERDSPARFSFVTGRIFELALLSGTWLVVCLEVGAGFAIHLLAGNTADPSIAVLRIQGLGLIGTFVATACTYPLLIVRRYRALLLNSLGALVLSAVLTATLVPSLGARGGAIAAVAAETAIAVSATIVLLRSERGVRLEFGVLPVAALAGAAGALSGRLLPIHPVLGVLVASLVYFAILRALGRFPREVWELLAGRFGSATRDGIAR
jgi:O-antigen/teichoic acid export membrane protein